MHRFEIPAHIPVFNDSQVEVELDELKNEEIGGCEFEGALLDDRRCADERLDK
jgi:hypothetical protein